MACLTRWRYALPLAGMARLKIVAAVGISVLSICLFAQVTSAEAQALTGDGNCDGRVDSIDAMLILKDAAGLPAPDLTCPANGDVDFHEGLTSQDALIVLQYHAALLAALPPDALRQLPATTCLPDPPPTDGFTMATDMLKTESDELIISRARRAALAGEIDGVLTMIRQGSHNLEDIHARSHTTSLVHVEPDADLMAKIVELVDSEGSRPFITGDPDFDLLNARLGLCGVHPLRAIGWSFLYLDSAVNGVIAAELYEATEGILDAYSSELKSDNSFVEAVKQHDTWYVMFRDAWGDCPSGCTDEELFFYSVSNGSVTEVTRSDAFTKPGFQQLIERLPGRPRQP